MDFNVFAKQMQGVVPLGSSLDFDGLACILQGVTLRISLDIDGMGHPLEFDWISMDLLEFCKG
jgi:hypothetical protein